MSIGKVTARYRVVPIGYYGDTKYKTKSFDVEIPVNESGFILQDTLNIIVIDYVKILCSDLKDMKFHSLIWWQLKENNKL